jgi:hypothetical protein
MEVISMEKIKIDGRLIDTVKQILTKKPLPKGFSMVELERLLEENNINYKDTGYAWASGDCENIIFWVDFKQEIPIAIKELQAEGKIRIDVTQPITYMIDGKMLNFPIVTQNRYYRTPHWLPIVLNTGREPDWIMKNLHIVPRKQRIVNTK